jgi:16S rRNA (cytosine1402-N4)-methyltransferase
VSACGAHFTVLLEEAVAALNVRSDGCYVDATFGRGGHSRGILSRLGPRGRLFALDRDPAAIASAAELDDARLHISHAPFSHLSAVLAGQGVSRVNGVLFDLGVSSPQIDEGARGFSFRADGPLDMRMDTTQGETAAEWLERASERDIAEVIKNYGEERFAFQIAKKIVGARSERRLESTGQLAALVATAVRTREPGQDPATRSFQAIRIHVNQELAELELSLPQALDVLAPAGRLAVISFHSLEDRVVKRFMRHQANPDTAPKDMPLRAADLPPARMILVGKAIRPSAAEVARNPRARSAVLRVAERAVTGEAA